MAKKIISESSMPLVRRFAADRGGNFIMLFGLSLPAAIGLLALGAETGSLYLQKTTLQSVADMAAVSAATASPDGAEALHAEGRAIAAQNGYEHGRGGVSVTVNNPPLSGPHTGDASAVEVIIRKTQPAQLSKYFHRDDYVITSRSVASRRHHGAPCVIALDPSAEAAIKITGSTEVKMPKCDVYANSLDAKSIVNKGAGVLTANLVSTAGGIVARHITANRIETHMAPVGNPYAALSVPAFSGCAAGPTRQDVQTLYPGVYCGGFRVGAGQTINLNPGLYIIDGGALEMTGGLLQGKDVTIVLTAAAGREPAALRVTGNAVAKLSAPFRGVFAGVAVFVDPRVSSDVAQTFGGSSESYIGGAIVAPSSVLKFGGAGESGTARSCTRLIANRIEFTGNSSVKSDCGDYGPLPLNATLRSALVE